MFWDNKKHEVNTDPDKIEAILSRGVSEVIDKDKLRSMLSSGQKLRVKLGIDPTSPNIHIGLAVVLRKLKEFQELGHQVVFIVGDFTGVIGDTSDKESERPMLSEKIIKENLGTYFKQAGKIIDLNKAETHYNSEWLEKLTYREIGQHADAFSVADFIARDNIKRRLEAGKRVSLREVLYPLMQGYDSVAVKADVEIGGLDQKFNMLAGRVLQEKMGLKPQNILMTAFPLTGTDGRKMSSSWGNVINISDSSNDMYGKVMSLKDDLIEEFFTLATDVSEKEIEEIKEKITSGSLHPKEAKMRLAREIVELYHGEKEAKAAEDNFVKTFSKGEVTENLPEVILNEGELLSDVLIRSEIVSSKSEFGRLIEAGAIILMPDKKVESIKEMALHGAVYKIGKHRFLKAK